MEQINYKHKIDFLLPNNAFLVRPTQTVVKSKYKKRKCNECNKRRKTLDNHHQICHVCYKIKMVFKYDPSGNKIIDDFIRYTQINLVKANGKIEFVPYKQFKDVEFIAEGGLAKFIKLLGLMAQFLIIVTKMFIRYLNNYTVVLKKINNSKNITTKELNEVQSILI
jgi:hypothetical protein